MRSFSSFQRYRKWDKVIEPLVKYNRDRSDLGYPLSFFDELQKSMAGGHNLTLNIATTLTGSKDNCIKTVFEGSEEVGRVTFAPAIIKSSFDAQIQKQMQDRILRLSQKDPQFQSFYTGLKDSNSVDQMLPLAVIKQKQSKGACRVLSLSKDEYKKATTLQSHQVAQGFILNSGKQASIIRFFYYPNKQNSEAYKIDNLEGFIKRRFGKSQFKVKQQIQNSLTFVKIMCSNKSFYKQTLSLVDFLQKYRKIKISVMVTDWILDPHNRYFLIDVKQIAYDKMPQISRPLRSRTDSLAFLTCQVCQQKFRQDQISKVLTSRLIGQFFEHLKKRQAELTFSTPVRLTSDTAKVCDLCYMLVVSESQLIELERKVAMVTHSINDSKGTYKSLMTGAKGLLYEWRLFLYLEDIRDLSIDNFDPKANYYIMIRIQNSITSYRLTKPTEKYQSVKGIKIHYLFSQQPKIDKFLTQSEITVRITKGNCWNAVVAEGNTSGLYQEGEKQAMRKFKQILIFNQKSAYAVVGIHIGVKMEGNYDPSKLSLNKAHDAFMVEENYSNCYALPAQWMETIDPSYCISKSQTQSYSYQLHLGTTEKKALLPSVLPQKKQKLKL